MSPLIVVAEVPSTFVKGSSVGWSPSNILIICVRLDIAIVVCSRAVLFSIGFGLSGESVSETVGVMICSSDSSLGLSASQFLVVVGSGDSFVVDLEKIRFLKKSPCINSDSWVGWGSGLSFLACLFVRAVVIVGL